MKITFQAAEAEQTVRQQTQVNAAEPAKKSGSVYGAVLLPGENRLLGSSEKNPGQNSDRRRRIRMLPYNRTIKP